jgi:hypothetical protein
MSRFIRLSARNAPRQYARRMLLQARYDEALDRLGPNDPLVQELRARIEQMNLDTRGQEMFDLSDPSEPWAGEQNPATAARMRLDYVRSINERLSAVGRGKVTLDEIRKINELNNEVLMGVRPDEISSAYVELEEMLGEIENRTEPVPFEPLYQ